MPTIACIVGSPSSPSRTAFVAAHVAAHLARAGNTVEEIIVRDLPAEDLLLARAEAPAIAAAVKTVERADGIVVATPIYKASFSGMLKTFLDLLPQWAFRGKYVLPIATGGASAHVLAIDYGLRPVLMSFGPVHVDQAYVVLEQGVRKLEGGAYELTPEMVEKLDGIADHFSRFLARS
jgi:FMN reductase